MPAGNTRGYTLTAGLGPLVPEAHCVYYLNTGEGWETFVSETRRIMVEVHERPYVVEKWMDIFMATLHTTGSKLLSHWVPPKDSQMEVDGQRFVQVCLHVLETYTCYVMEAPPDGYKWWTQRSNHGLFYVFLKRVYRLGSWDAAVANTKVRPGGGGTKKRKRTTGLISTDVQNAFKRLFGLGPGHEDEGLMSYGTVVYVAGSVLHCPKFKARLDDECRVLEETYPTVYEEASRVAHSVLYESPPDLLLEVDYPSAIEMVVDVDERGVEEEGIGPFIKCVSDAVTPFTWFSTRVYALDLGTASTLPHLLDALLILKNTLQPTLV